jgi:hypothetical protein
LGLFYVVRVASERPRGEDSTSAAAESTFSPDCLLYQKKKVKEKARAGGSLKDFATDLADNAKVPA